MTTLNRIANKPSILFVAMVLLLSACGGGSDDDPTSLATESSALSAEYAQTDLEPGVLEIRPGTDTGSDTDTDTPAADGARQAQAEATKQARPMDAGAPAPNCGTNLYYRSQGANALAKVFFPAGTPRAVVMYAHPTNNANVCAAAKLFTDVGMTVVAPMYIDRSYLVRNVQTLDVIDALFAAKNSYFSNVANPRLFLTGFSQGGFVAMATHRAILQRQRSGGGRDPRAEFNLIASFPISGPYDVAYSETNTNNSTIHNKTLDAYNYRYGQRWTDVRQMVSVMEQNNAASGSMSLWRTSGRMQLCYGTRDTDVPTANTLYATANQRPEKIIGISGANHLGSEIPCARAAAQWFSSL